MLLMLALLMKEDDVRVVVDGIIWFGCYVFVLKFNCGKITRKPSIIIAPPLPTGPCLVGGGPRTLEEQVYRCLGRTRVTNTAVETVEYRQSYLPCWTNKVER